MTGGPNNWAAEFVYPHLGSDNSYVSYNYKDTVNVSWISWATNSTPTTMQIYWWDPTFSNNQWLPLDLLDVRRNGSRTYKLDNVPNNGGGWYLGQWNLNFTRADNSPPTGLTLSQVFNCTFDDSIAPRNFGEDSSSDAVTSSGSALPTPTGPTSIVSVPTSTPTDDANGSSSNGGATATAASAANVNQSHSLSGGAIAGVVIGVLAALALAAAGGFFLWRRRRRQNAAATGDVAAPPGAAGGPFTPGGVPPTPGTGHGVPIAGGPNAAMYGAPGTEYKQVVPPSGPAHQEYYSKAALPPPPMGQNPMYSELPAGNDHSQGAIQGSIPRSTGPNEMQGSQPIRQELPG